MLKISKSCDLGYKNIVRVDLHELNENIKKRLNVLETLNSLFYQETP